MNHIYKVVWSKTTNSLVVVSELASSQGKAASVVSKGYKLSSVFKKSFQLTALSALLISVMPAAQAAIAVGASTVTNWNGAVSVSLNGASATGASVPYNYHTPNNENYLDQGNNSNSSNIYSGTLSAAQSIAIGINATSQSGSIALGDNSRATGGLSLALGAFSQTNQAGAIALGTSALASGFNSFATMRQAAATADFAIAMGTAANANATNSIAMGSSALALGNQSIAIGSAAMEKKVGSAGGESYRTDYVGTTNTKAQGDRTIAFGVNTSTTSNDSIAIGSNSKTNAGTGAIAIGWCSSTSYQDSVAIGSNATANGGYSLALGYNATSTNLTSISIGWNAAASNTGGGHSQGAVAIGPKTTALGNQSVVLGASASAVEQATAIGNDSKANGFGSIVIGGDDTGYSRNPNSDPYTPTALGGERIGYLANTATGDNSNYRSSLSSGIGSVVVGVHGQALSNGSTAIGVYSTAGDNGITFTNDTTSTTAIEATAIGALSRAKSIRSSAIGYSAEALGNYSTVVGANSTANGTSSLALGHNSTAYSTYSLAAGYNASANLSNSTAIGSSSNASGLNAIALGTGAQALNTNTISIGTGNIVSGENSGAIGDPNNITGSNSYALGNNNVIYANNSFAVGNSIYISDTAQNTLAFGTNISVPTSTKTNNTLIGTSAKIQGGESSIAFGTNATVSNSVQSSAIAIGNQSKVEAAVGGIAIGNGSTISSSANNGSIALGQKTNVTGVSSIALGNNASVTGTQQGSVAIGNNTNVTNTGQGTVAVGSDTNVTVGNAVAIGDHVNVKGQRSIAIGSSSNVAEGVVNATTIGTGSNVTQNDGTAVGYNAIVSNYNGLALGANATSTAQRAVALGADSVAGREGWDQAAYDPYIPANANTSQSAAITATKATNNYGAVSVGSDTVKRQIINVAAGSADSDAVNVAQLKAAIGSVNTSWNIQENGTQKDIVNAGDNVSFANGTGTTANVSVDSTGKTSTVKYSVNKSGLSVATDGTVTAAANGDNFATAEQVAKAINDSEKTTTVEKGSDKVSVTGTTTGTKTNYVVDLSNAAKSSLDKADSALQSWTAQVNGANAKVVNQTNNTVNFVNGTNTIVKADANGNISVSTTDNVTFNTVNASSFNAGNISIGTNGINAGNTTITNVANGTNASDAVNVSQLNATNANVTNNTQNITNNTAAIANNTANISNNTNAIANNTQNIMKNAADIQSTKDGLNATNATVAGNTANITNNTNAIANNTAAINKGINFGNGTTANNFALGSTINVTSDSNIEVSTVADGVKLALASSIAVDNLTANNSVKVGNVALTQAGINAGNHAITNVTNGTNATDAVNLSQLNASKSSVEAGDNVAVTSTSDANGTVYTVNANTSTVSNGSDKVTVTSSSTGNHTTNYAVDLSEAAKSSLNKADSALQSWTAQVNGVDAKVVNQTNNTVNFVNGTNTIVKADANGNISVSTADNVTFNTVNASTFNAGNVSISNNGINAGNTTITNVANGTNASDAVNLSQLNATNANVTNNTKNITNVTNLVNQGFNIGADNGADDNVKLGEKVDFNGDGNIVTTVTNNAIAFALSNTLNLTDAGSVTMGDTVVNSTGMLINNGSTDNQTVSLTKDGLNNGGNTITGVANGSNATDAVNLSQLNAGKSSVEAGDNVAVTSTSDANGTVYTVNANTSTVSNGSDKVTVTSSSTGNHTTNYALDLSEAAKASLDKADSALQSLTTSADGTKAQTLDKDNSNANFISGSNIRLTPSADGITIATAENVTFTNVNTTNFKAGDVTINSTGIDAGNHTITNVAKGVNATDAVNLSQLESYVGDNSYNWNLSDGTNSSAVADNSTVAITGSANGDGANTSGIVTELNGTNVSVDLSDKAKESLDKADSALQSWTAQVNGTDAKVVNQTNNTVNFVDGSNINITNDNGTIKVATADNVTFNTVNASTFNAGNVSISNSGINAGNHTITNVSNGTKDSDAVNLSQLNATNANVTNNTNNIANNTQNITSNTNAINKGINFGNGTTANNFALGSTINVTSDSNIVVNTTNAGVQLGLADNIAVDNVTVNNTFKAGDVTINNNGIDAGNHAITNVTNGTNATDAVNVSQLNASKSSVEAGDNVAVTSTSDANGTVYTVNANTSTVSNGSDKVTVTSSSTGNHTTNYALDLSDAAKASLDKADSALQSLTTSADGAKAQTLDKDNSNANFISGSNIRLTPSADGITIATAENVTFTNVNTTNFKAGDVTINSTGIDAGNHTITNVAAGTNKTDAVNLGQLEQFIGDNSYNWNLSDGTNSSAVADNSTVAIEGSANGDSANTSGIVTMLDGTNVSVDLSDKAKVSLDKADSALQSWTAQVNGADAKVVNQTNNTVNFVNGTNTIVKADANGNISVSTADNVTFNTVNASTFNAGNVSISNNGINAGNTTITNVANGTNASDAVNLSQLNATNANVTNNTNNIANNTQNITNNANNIANNTANITNNTNAINKGINFGNGTDANKFNLGDTINVTSDSNIVVSTVADGVKLALASSIAVNNITVNDTFKAGDVTINSTGIDAGNHTITNVAAGTNATDAVNLAQLESYVGDNSYNWNLSDGTNNNAVADSSTVAITGSANGDGANTSGIVTELNGTNVSVDLSNKTKADIQQGVDANTTVNTKGITFAADSGTATERKLGETLAINGDGDLINTTVSAGKVEVAASDKLKDAVNNATTALQSWTAQVNGAAAKVVNQTNNTVNFVNGTNTIVKADANGNISVSTADNVTFNTVNASTFNAGGVSISNSGINAGNTTITNVANGTQDSDAVNLSQLNATNANVTNNTNNIANNTQNITSNANNIANNTANITNNTNAINKGINFGNGSTANNFALGSTINVTSDSNIVVNTTSSGVQLALADSIAVGNVTVNDTFKAGDVTINNNGIDAGNHTITNVANGSNASDAVNVAQLEANTTRYYSVNSTVAGNRNNDGATGINAMAAGANAVASGDNATAIGQGTKANSAAAIAIGNNANATSSRNDSVIAIGNNAQSTGSYSIAVGTNSVANHTWSMAMGISAKAIDDYATALGSSAQATSQWTTALGAGANATGSAATAVGSNTTATAGGATVVGYNSSVTGANTTALGNNINVDTEGSVVLGNGSAAASATTETTATVNNLTYSGFAGADNVATGDYVSVGSVGEERQIKNVAAGNVSATSTDAINGSQLYATQNVIGNVANSVVNNFGGNATVDQNGNITFTDIGGTGANTIHDAIQNVSNVANMGWNVQANGDTATKVAPGDTVQFINGQNIEIDRDGTNITVATANNVTFTNVNTTTLTAGPVTINSTGIDAGNHTITNVGKGVNATDAVNLSQLESYVGDNSYNWNLSDGNNSSAVADNSTVAITGSANADSANTSGIVTELNGTNVSVDLSNKTKADIQQGVDANTTVNTKGITFAADSGTATERKLGETLAINGDGDLINTTVSAGKVEVAASDKLKDAVNNATTALQSWTAQVNGTDAKVVDQTNNTVNFVDGNNINITNNNGTIKVATTDNVTFNTVNASTFNAGGVSISNSGINAGNTTITNVANGTQDSDAVNLSQLNATNANVTNNTNNIANNTANITNNTNAIASNTAMINKGINFGNGTDANKFNLGDTINVTSDSNIVVSTVADGVKLALASSIAVNNITVNDTFKAGDVTINSTGIDAGNHTITNVAKGVNATDAVNLSQLESYVGDNSYNWNLSDGTNNNAVADNSTVTITGSANGDSANTSGIVTELNGTNVSVDLSNKTKADIQQGVDANTTVNTKGITFAADSGTATERKLGETLAINGDGDLINTTVSAGKVEVAASDKLKGAVNNATTALQSWTAQVNGADAKVVNQTNNTVNFVNGTNTIVKADANGNISVSTADNVTFNTVNASTFNAGNVSISNSGINAGNHTITNVSNGTKDSDAVNLSQLNATNANVTNNTNNIANNTKNITNVTNLVNQGFNIGADNGTDNNVKLGEKVDFNGDGNIVTTVTNNAIAFALSNTLNLTDAGSVTMGDTVVNGSGMIINNGSADNQTVSLTKDGLNNGGNTITNVAIGSNATDAVNLSQLNASKSSVEAGDNVAVTSTSDANGTVYTVNANSSTVSNGSDKITVTQTDAGNHTSNYAVDLSEAAKSSLNKADSALQSWTAQVNGTDAKVVNQTNNTVNFVNGTNTIVKADANGNISVSTADNVTFNTVNASTFNAGGVSISNSGINAGNTTITNVANGTQDSDAVNLSQLNATNANVTNNTQNITNNTAAIANNTANISNNTNAIANNTQNITKNAADIQSTKDGLNATNATVAGNTANITNNTNAIANNTATINKGINFGNGTTANNFALGSTINVTSDSNIEVSTVADGVKLALASSIAVDNLTANNSVKVGNVALTQAGINAGNHAITNVTNGTNATDAVNVQQLTNAVNNASSGSAWKITENNDATNAKTVGNSTVSFNNGSNTIAVVNGTNVTYNLADNITLTNAGSVTIGNTMVNNDGIKVGNETTISNGSATIGSVTIASTGKISGVAKGTLNAASTEAVNGSQLYETNQNVSNLTAQLSQVNQTANAGWKLAVNGTSTSTVAPNATVSLNNSDNNVVITKDANSSNVTFGLNSTLNIGNGANTVKVDGTNGSISTGNTTITGDNVKTTTLTTGNTTINNDGLVTGNVTVKQDGINAGGNKITGVADGDISANSTDAVNGGQLYNVIQNATAGVKTEVEAGKNIVVTNSTGANGQTVYTVETAKEVDFDKVTVGNVTINKDTNKVSGIANGDISATSSDAINGSQLYTANQNVADHLGGGSKVDENGNVTAPTYTVVTNPSTNATTTANNVGDAINGLNTAISKPLTFAADSGSNSEMRLGSTVSIKGGVSDSTKLSDNNIGVVSDGKGNLTVKLAKDISGLNSVTTGDTTMNSEGITINNGAAGSPVSLTKNGLNNGGNRITNVAPGEVSQDSTDAVNGSQLHATNQQVVRNAQAINQVANHVNKVDRNLRAGIAGAMAAGGLYHATLPGKSMVAAGVGTYRGESAIAVGYSRLSDNGKLGVKFSVNGNTRGDTGAAASVGYQW
ncbi:YadA-like family protein [Basfia succiniciproducens]|nr:YadA-like family protein [Basfia succiniciproducens]QIM68176.1 hypothetical protein A4G13_01555 [Basfia succiniciproducens]